MDATPLDLAEVGKQVGERDVGPRGQMLYGGKQLIVRNGRQGIAVSHISSYTRNRNTPTFPSERRSCAWTIRNSNFARTTVQRACQTRTTASRDDLPDVEQEARKVVKIKRRSSADLL